MNGTAERFGSHRVAASATADEASAALSEVFLPVRVVPAERSPDLRTHLNAVTAGRITFGYMDLREPVRIVTAEPVDFPLDVPVRAHMTTRAGRGERIRATEDTAGVFMPGRPVELDCSEWFAQVAVRIPHEDLQTELELLLDEPLATPLEFDAAFDMTTGGGRAVSRALELVDEGSRQPGGLLAHTLAVHSREQVFLQALLLGQPHNHSVALDVPRGSSGARSVARAVELLRADLVRPWTVGALASAVPTSVRSLQEAFRRELDTTPMTYLRRLRMERAREDLIAGGPRGVSVSEVAVRWGFLHVSRFAGSYADRFGELPSDTLRRTRA